MSGTPWEKSQYDRYDNERAARSKMERDSYYLNTPNPSKGGFMKNNKKFNASHRKSKNKKKSSTAPLVENYEKYNVSSGGFSTPYYKSKGFSITEERGGDDSLGFGGGGGWASHQAFFQRLHEKTESSKAARWLETDNRRKRNNDLVMKWGPLGLGLSRRLGMFDDLRMLNPENRWE